MTHRNCEDCWSYPCLCPDRQSGPTPIPPNIVKCNKVKPITPAEAAKNKPIPDFVVEAVNELLAKEVVNGYAWLKQSKVEAAIKMKMPKGETFKLWWLDFEDLYRAAGWTVVYDKPDYNNWEIGSSSYFKFSVK